MKKAYVTPMVKKVAFVYQDHVAAESYPINNYADPWLIQQCTYGNGQCSVVYNVKARGADDCLISPNG